MKGIILAGGTGSRLHPMTLIVNKHLLPVYDKPMIFFPLSVLMLAGIKEILIITNPHDVDKFETLLGNGSKWGIFITYAFQETPKGLAEAFIIGEKFIGSDSVTMMLGDNILYSSSLQETLSGAILSNNGASVFAYHVAEPQKFGIVEFDKSNNPISIEEKPLKPKSNFALIGLYIFDNNVINYAKNTIPSKRGELEITSIINMYLASNKLKVIRLGRGTAWLDAGEPKSLLETSQYIYISEKRQGLQIANLTEIAKSKGFLKKY